MEIRKLVGPGREAKSDKTQSEEFPIRVADDWDVVVNDASKMADVIDRHLDFESKLQGKELHPLTLCPEQRVSLVSDLRGMS